jgi:hypothetical protein
MTRDQVERKTNGDIACLATTFAVVLALGIEVDPGLAAPAAAQPAALAPAITPIPAAQLALYQKYTGLLQPGVKSWIESQAQVERTKSSLDLAALTAAIHARFDPTQAPAAGGLSPAALDGSEAAELAVLVVLEMIQDEDNDLQAQMIETEAQVAAKQSLQAAANILSMDTGTLVSAGAVSNTVDAATPVSAGATTICAPLRQDLAAINRALAEGKTPMQVPCPATTSNVASAATTLQNDLDSDNEVSEMTSMRLQMLMDMRSKLLQTASDMEKSLSDTDMAIVGNIKQ